MELTKPGSTEVLPRDILAIRRSRLEQYDLCEPSTQLLLDELVNAAVRACCAPIAWITFGDLERQQVRAGVGLQQEELPAGNGTFLRVIETHATLAIADVQAIESITSVPLVAESTCGRSLAGVSLRTPDGIVLGTLAVMDVMPRQFQAEHLQLLNALGQQAIAHLEVCRSLQQVGQQSLADTRAAANTSLKLTRQAVSSHPRAEIEWEAAATTWQFTSVKADSERLLGYTARQWLATPSFWSNLLLPADREALVRQRHDDIRTGCEREVDYRVMAANGQIVWLRERSQVTTQTDSTGAEIRYLQGTLQDITQFKQAEIERDRFFHLSPDIIVEMGFDCRIRRVNPAWQLLTGFTPDELDTQSLLDFVHPDDVIATRDRLEALYRGQRITDFEHRLVHRDGTSLWLSWHAVPYENDQLIYAIARDITDRKRVELALQQQSLQDRLTSSLSRHMQQTASLDDILAASARDIQQTLNVHRVAIVSLRADRAGSLVAESALPPTRPWSNLLLNQPGWFDTLAWCQANGMWHADNLADATASHEVTISDYWRNRGGRSAIAAPVYNDDRLWGLLLVQCCQPHAWTTFELDLVRHVVEHLAVVVRQTDDRQHMQLLNADLKIQAEIRTAEVQLALEFEALLKRITDKVRDSLDESQILQTAVEEVARGLEANCCNAALYDLENRTSTVYYDFAENVPPMGRQQYFMENAPEIYDQLLQGQHFQYCALYPNPRRGRVAMLACPIVDDRGVLGDLWAINRPGRGFTTLEVRLVQQVANQCAIAIRQARLYSAAQAQVEELEKLNRLKDDFLSTISHELRTPVSNMKMAVSLLKVKLTQLLNVQQLQLLERYLAILTTECEREIQLIDDLLDLNHLEYDTTPTADRPLALADWLREAIDPFIERASARKQAIQLDVDPGIPDLRTDPVVLGRVVAELMQNAYKYTPAGGQIWVSAQIEDSQCMLRFTNTGVTIVPTELEHIFDKFYRIPRSDPWQQGGTGLGLALVKKLVNHLGGTIHVSSSDGEVTFIVQLPCEP
ncbi:MAG: GAF domain-containing protein [Cyanobacteria bacterium P01_D01_bin.123]